MLYSLRIAATCVWTTGTTGVAHRVAHGVPAADGANAAPGGITRSLLAIDDVSSTVGRTSLLVTLPTLRMKVAGLGLASKDTFGSYTSPPLERGVYDGGGEIVRACSGESDASPLLAESVAGGRITGAEDASPPSANATRAERGAGDAARAPPV